MTIFTARNMQSTKHWWWPTLAWLEVLMAAQAATCYFCLSSSPPQSNTSEIILWGAKHLGNCSLQDYITHGALCLGENIFRNKTMWGEETGHVTALAAAWPLHPNMPKEMGEIYGIYPTTVNNQFSLSPPPPCILSLSSDPICVIPWNSAVQLRVTDNQRKSIVVLQIRNFFFLIFFSWLSPNAILKTFLIHATPQLHAALLQVYSALL